MKTRLLYSLITAVLFWGMSTVITYSQTYSSITWYLDQVDSTTPTVIYGPLTGQPIVGSPLKDNVQFVIRSYTGGFTGTGPIPGVSSSMRWWPVDGSGTAVSWGNETGQNNDRYVQLQAAPKPGYSWTVDTLSIWLAGGGTSYVRARIYWSTDPLFIVQNELTPDTGIALQHATNVGIAQYTYPVNISVSDGQSLYFRVYPWYTASPSTSKYLYTQYAYFSGTTSPTTAVKESPELPKTYSLLQNYPNPFNPSTVIEYQVPKSSFVKITVYNLLGNVVENLVNEQQSAGDYTVTFNAVNLPSGIYFYTINAGSFTQTKKMMLIK